VSKGVIFEFWDPPNISRTFEARNWTAVNTDEYNEKLGQKGSSGVT